MAGCTPDKPQDSLSLKVQKAFLRGIKLFTSTSVLLAVNAQMVSVFSSLLYKVEVKPIVLLTAFFLTIFVYNMNKVTDTIEDRINQPDIILVDRSFYLISSFTALLFCLFFSTLIGVKALLIVLTSSFASITYSIRLSKSIPRLKEVVGVKSIIVATSWGLTGALLPACIQIVEPLKMILIFFYIFVQIFINTILCDIRDLNGDRVSGLSTIPVVLGLNKTRKLLLIINSLIAVWIKYCYSNRLFLEYMPSFLFSLIYGYVIIVLFSREGQSRLHVELAVDGEWIPLVTLMRIL